MEIRYRHDGYRSTLTLISAVDRDLVKLRHDASGVEFFLPALSLMRTSEPATPHVDESRP